jgi:hypothetical protein
MVTAKGHLPEGYVRFAKPRFFSLLTNALAARRDQHGARSG